MTRDVFRIVVSAAVGVACAALVVIVVRIGADGEDRVRAGFVLTQLRADEREQHGELRSGSSTDQGGGNCLILFGERAARRRSVITPPRPNAPGAGRINSQPFSPTIALMCFDRRKLEAERKAKPAADRHSAEPVRRI